MKRREWVKNTVIAGTGIIEGLEFSKRFIQGVINNIQVLHLNFSSGIFFVLLIGIN